MSLTVTAWLVLTFILGLLATLAIWARGFSRARGLAVGAFLLASPAAAAALAVSLGWPVPYVPGVTVPEGKHPLLGAKMVMGVGIFILLDIGDAEPRYYKMPWSNKSAEELQGAQEEGGEEGEVGVITPPFEFSWDQSPPKFYALPQPKMLPDKPQQETAPNYDQSI